MLVKVSSYLDLLISVVLAFVLAGSTLVPGLPVAVDMVLGLVFLGYIPGYVLVMAMLPRREDLPSEQRQILSIILSFTLAPMIGYLLHNTPFGLQLSAWKLTIASLTLAASGVAGLRRKWVEPKERYLPLMLLRPGALIKERLVGMGSSPLSPLSWGIVLAVVALGGSIIYAAVTFEGSGTYTEFYILNTTTPDGQLKASSNEETTGAVVELWVVNQERQCTSYTIAQGSGQHEAKIISEFTLDHGESSKVTIDLSDVNLDQDKVIFQLFVNNKPEPYRFLVLGP